MDDHVIVKGVLEQFFALCAIPHPSGHEEAVSRYLCETLRAWGYTPEMDEDLNILCDIPATEGFFREKRLVLQAHSDMVCVGVEDYDMLRDPIRAEVRDGYLITDGRSSLGADCGIGLAAALYLIRSGMPHGPLRLIVTADEERGLSGVKKLRRDALEGCVGLINLDGFHFGRLTVSNAGGLRQCFTKTPEVFFPMLETCLRLEISGLRGGHSGDDIHRGRANGAQAMVWLLQSLNIPYELARISVGADYNAIPTAGFAEICVDSRDLDTLHQVVSEFQKGLRETYGENDPNITVTVAPTELPDWVFTVDQRDDLLALAGLIQCGAWEEHPLCPRCVGSSGTMGRLFADGGKVEIFSFLRSYSDEIMEQQADFYRMAAEGFGFSVWWDMYPAWLGVAEDPLTDLFLRQGEKLGISMEKSAAHVGLETSVFHSMDRELPMVSTGMDVIDAHSVGERVRMETIAPFVRLLATVAKEYRG